MIDHREAFICQVFCLLQDIVDAANHGHTIDRHGYLMTHAAELIRQNQVYHSQKKHEPLILMHTGKPVPELHSPLTKRKQCSLTPSRN